MTRPTPACGVVGCLPQHCEARPDDLMARFASMPPGDHARLLEWALWHERGDWDAIRQMVDGSREYILLARRAGGYSRETARTLWDALDLYWTAP